MSGVSAPAQATYARSSLAHLRAGVTGVAATACLVGCAAGGTDVGPPAVTPACANAIIDAAGESKPGPESAGIRASLDTCLNVNEWSTALARYPSALGLTALEDVRAAVDLACRDRDETAVCQDAIRTGLRDSD